MYYEKVNDDSNYVTLSTKYICMSIVSMYLNIDNLESMPLILLYESCMYN